MIQKMYMKQQFDIEGIRVKRPRETVVGRGLQAKLFFTSSLERSCCECKKLAPAWTLEQYEIDGPRGILHQWFFVWYCTN